MKLRKFKQSGYCYADVKKNVCTGQSLHRFNSFNGINKGYISSYGLGCFKNNEVNGITINIKTEVFLEIGFFLNI